MSKADKTLAKVLSGKQDENIEFADVCHLLAKLGYTMRRKGSHHSFTKMDSTDFFNLQPNGRKAKSYQIRQIRAILQNK